ncbi:MAG: PhoH family protein [Bacteroidales bacterium]|nr:PhoH family protein [Bacteroidales bacterium]
MVTKDTKKTFVLDTNVILHDFRSIYNFEENDVVVPIVVLEELDKFKKGNDTINIQAREFMRILDRLTETPCDLEQGIPLGEGRGHLYIMAGKPFSEAMKLSFSEPIPDHKILAVAIWIKEHFPEKRVYLVSQDINLRMKSRSLGMEAQDYKTGKVENTEKLFQGMRMIPNTNDDIVSKLYQVNKITLEESGIEGVFESNDYFLIGDENANVMCYYNSVDSTINKVSKLRAAGIKPRNVEQSFLMDALMRSDVSLVAVTGKAGTGKTLLALAAAVEQSKQFMQIFLSRPIVPLGNKDLGYLPGNEKQKVSPYMQPLFDNLNVIKQTLGVNSKNSQQVDAMVKEEKLLVAPLAYIRGRSLNNVFFIVDESQNLTPHEVKTIITRAGEGSKIVFTGDVEQIDSPFLDMRSNGLSYLANKMKGQDFFAHINLVHGERSRLSDVAGRLLD